MEQTTPINPLISVIIPVYNVSQFLDRCLESVVHQTYQNLEIILIDDGSTDSSGLLCDEWAIKDSRIRVIHTSNSGAAAARNAGLDVAGGAYITFVDADDYLEKNILETMLEVLHNHNASCCMCGYTPVDELGDKKQTVAVNCETKLSGIQAIKERYLHHKMEYNIVNPWGKLFAASMWKDLRFTKGLYYEDLDIMPYLYHRCDCMVAIPQNGYFYYLRSGSASRGTGTDDKRYIDSVLVRQKHVAFYKSIGEYGMSISVTQMLYDLIITSACNGWIPADEEKFSQNTYRQYLKDILRSPAVSVKNKVRYLLYGIVGAQGYKLLIQNGK